MATRDLGKNVDVQRSFALGAQTVAADGTTVDLAGFESAVAVLDVGLQSGTSCTFILHESDDGTTWNAVSTADCGGVTNSFVITTANDNATYKVPYVGGKRYLRWELTAATAGNVLVSGLIVRGSPRSAPLAA